jgi:3D (Asp-Asp-Asp) domain-containing protein
MGIAETIVLWSMVTAYRSVPTQTDKTPFHTSINEHVSNAGVAVSRDQLCPASLFRDIRIKRHGASSCHLKHKVHYGDVVHITGVGYRIVNDCMAARHRNAWDVWVPNFAAERAITPMKRRVTRIRVN